MPDETVGSIIDDLSNQTSVIDVKPKEGAEIAEHEFMPWSQYEYVVIGQKGIYLAPKGSAYPKPNPEGGSKPPMPENKLPTPPKKPDQMERTEVLEANKLLTDKVRTLEEKMESLSAKFEPPVPPKKETEEKAEPVCPICKKPKVDCKCSPDEEDAEKKKGKPVEPQPKEDPTTVKAESDENKCKPKPDDEEEKKKKAAMEEKTPEPPKSQSPSREEADHSNSPWVSALRGINRGKCIAERKPLVESE